MIEAIIQARMGSERLPGKVLMPLAGKPLIAHVVERVSRSMVNQVTVAIPDTPENDPLYRQCSKLGVNVKRGSERDVLARFMSAARGDTIVRITADCPLIDPDVINEVMAAYQGGYCSNTLVRTWPIGMDVEVFGIDALELAFNNADRLYQREHVTPYIYEQPELFTLTNVTAPDWATHPDWRFTVDTREDLEFCECLAGYPDLRSQIEAVTDDLLCINKHVEHRYIRGT